MTGRIALAAVLGAAALAASPAWACTIQPPPAALPGESPDAYKARVRELYRKEAADLARMRQTDALRNADLIFIARDTAWAPRYRSPPVRRGRAGQPLPPVPLRPVVVKYPAPSYFTPIDWLRGARTDTLFRVERFDTSCGPQGFGDTMPSQPGDLYLFFARRGPLSEKTLIDAIALDKIDNPALTAFVARHRGKPTAARP